MLILYKRSCTEKLMKNDCKNEVWVRSASNFLLLISALKTKITKTSKTFLLVLLSLDQRRSLNQ